MSDPEELARALAQLAAPAEPGARRLPGGPAAVPALFDEIETTVLARRLVLTRPDGEVLVVEAAHRRLLGFAQPVPPDVNDLVATLPEAGLAYAGPDALASIRRALSIFCAESTELTLHSEPIGRVVPPDEAGSAVSALRQATETEPEIAIATGSAPDLGPPVTGDFLERVVATLLETMEASVLRGATGDTTTGDPDVAADLADALETVEEEWTLVAKDPAAIILDSVTGTLLFARAGDARLAALFAEGACARVAQVWRHVERA